MNALRRLLVITLAIPAGMNSAFAVDLVVRELELTIEALPTELEWAISRTDLSLGGDDSLKSHVGLSLSAAYSWAGIGEAQGLLVESGLAVGQGRFEGDGTYDWAEARIGLSWAWATSHDLTLSAGMLGAVGLDRLEFEGAAGGDNYHGDGAHLAFIPNVQARWRLSPSWSLRAMAGWRWSRSPFENDDLDLDIEQSGPMLAIGVSYAFSSAPAGFE